MSCNHITYYQGAKVARPITSREEYLKLRNSTRNINALQAARNGDEKAKMHLLQFNYSGYYPEGKIRGSRFVSKAFGFDIDSPEDFERVIPTLLADPDKYGLLMMERSVRNGGHLVLRRDVQRTILENQVSIATALECEMDTNAHDSNRVFFTTSASEQDLLYLSDTLFADAYDSVLADSMLRTLEQRVEELPQGAHSGNKHYRPWMESKNESMAGEAPMADSQQQEANGEPPTDYQGIPYQRIIDKYWELHNEGKAPMMSNRDVLTYELAYNLRHVCGFSRELMDKVIPNYDGFPQEEKMKCIDSALSDRRTHMPRKLRVVLDAVRQDLLEENHSVSSIDDLEQEEDHHFANSLPPTLSRSVRDSIAAVGPSLAFPVLACITPLIGALATGVQLSVHGKFNTLNLISYVAGDAASGKGSIDPIVNAWLYHLKQEDDVYLAQEEDYRQRKKAAKNKKEQPEEPSLPIRCLTLNNTVANLADRLGKTQGKHAISFTPEADSLAQQWRSSMSNYSIMLRIAYDAVEFHREAKSLDAVNVHIPNLRWNVVMMGTPDALYRVVSNYTDGFQSRIALACTPDNTYSPLPSKFYSLTPEQEDNIHNVADLLTMLEGKVDLPKLEAAGQNWLETIRLAAMKNDDKIMARQRFRVCVTAQRMVCCLMLASVCDKLLKEHGLAGAQKRLRTQPNCWVEMLEKEQVPSLLNLFGQVADSLLDNNLAFFRERITMAIGSSDYPSGTRVHYGKNDNIYESLDASFTFEQAWQTSINMKGSSVTKNSVRQMLKNWKKQGLIVNTAPSTFKKVNNC